MCTVCFILFHIGAKTILYTAGIKTPCLKEPLHVIVIDAHGFFFYKNKLYKNTEAKNCPKF